MAEQSNQLTIGPKSAFIEINLETGEIVGIHPSGGPRSGQNNAHESSNVPDNHDRDNMALKGCWYYSESPGCMWVWHKNKWYWVCT